MNCRFATRDRSADLAPVRGLVRLPLLLAIVMTAAAALAPRGSAVFEFWYREITPRWAELTRVVLQGTKLSFSLISIAALVVITLMWSVIAWRRQRTAGAKYRAWWAGLRPWISNVLWVYLLAFLPWAVLHRRLPIEDRRHWPELSSSEVVSILRREAAALDRTLNDPSMGSPEHEIDRSPSLLELRAAQSGLDAVRQIDPATPSIALGARMFWPAGALATFGISGIFLPGWMEPHVEPDLTADEKFFAIAHEEAHRGGFTSEAEANLAAYLGLAAAPERELRLAALVALVMHADQALFDPQFGAPLAVSEEVIAAVRLARQRGRAQRTDLLAKPAAQLNDAYLRASGDRGGVRSYGIFPALLARARAVGF